MTGDLVPHTTDVQRVKAGMVFAEFGSDDPFEIAFRPAAVVLDAAVALRGSLIWLDRQRQGNKRLSPLDLSRASQNRDVAVQRCEAISKDDELYRAMRLFESAECEPALEGWVHIAIGIAFIEAVEIALHHGFNGGTVLAHGLKSSAGRGVQTSNGKL
jgi:hypothetical protein